MKLTFILLVCLHISAILHAQVSKTININSGELKTSLTSTELGTITNLNLTGTIDARDFRIMRDSMPLLAEVDLIGVEIIAYSGTEGTSSWGYINYPANTIPQSAFYYKDSLTSIVLPSSIVTIDQNAFYHCDQLAAIVIPTSVTSIKIQAFAFCSGLTSLIIPNSVTSIADFCFYYCTNLTTVSIPPSVTHLGLVAFGNSGLETVNIPSSVISFRPEVFTNCNKLKKITVNSNSPVDLNYSPRVFRGVDKSTCILYVPFGAKTAYQAADQWKDFLTIEELPGLFLSTATLDFGANAGSSLFNIASSEAWTATSDQSWLTLNPGTGALGSSSVALNYTANSGTSKRTGTISVSASDLETQTIVVSQGGITEVTAGNLKTLLGDQLATIASLTLAGTIDARDFKTMRDDMPVLAHIDLSAATIVAYTGTGGTSIWGNTNYTANTIPEHAFMNSNWQGKTSLKTFVFPANATSVSQLAFYNCTNLTDLVISPVLSTIGNASFSYCTGLVTINIPNTVTSIGSSAFAWCSALKDISIPASVSSIGISAFGGLNANIEVDGSSQHFSSAEGILYNKTKTILIQCPVSKQGSFTVPATVTTISSRAFMDCTKLSSITLPAMLSTIGDSAFTYCLGLGSIVLPVQLSSIGNYAFQSCTNLTSITVKASNPVNLSNRQGVFNNINKTTCILKVPFGSKAAYQAASQWKDFLTIEEQPGLYLSIAKLNFGANAGSSQVNIASSEAWTAVSNQSWLTLDPGTGALGSSSVALNYTANSGTTIRTATITVSATGLETQSIAVTQYGLTEVTAGNLKTQFADQLAAITSLTLTGTIDARDFKTMRDDMPLLANIDLSAATIVAYTGTEGTTSGNIAYLANTVPERAFVNSNWQGKASLKTFVFPTNVTSVGQYAFYNCSNLNSVVLSPQLITIGNYSFYICRGLTVINIPSPVTTIGSYAFYYCTGLTGLTIPASVTTIGSYAFAGCNILTSITAKGTIPVNLTNSYEVFNGINKTACVLKVPFGSKTVYQAASQWKDFLTIEELPGLYLSASTLDYGANAGSSLFNIASSEAWTATSDQSWLTLNPGTGALGSSSVALNYTANSGTSKRTGTISVSASGLETQSIAVTQYGLTEVTAGNLKTLLGGQLATINSLTLTGTIDARDFKTMRDDMPLLANIDLSGATIVEYTGTEGTSNWGNTIYLANTIPEFAFDYKASLKTFVFPANATSVGQFAFFICRNLNSVVFSPQLKTIDRGSFSYCNGLTVINIPSSVTNIGSNAFEYCTGLTGLTFPASVTLIDSYAFAGCNILTSITAKAGIPVNLNNSQGVFNNVNKTTCILKVPFGSKTAYQAADQWKDFLTIEELPDMSIICQKLQFKTGWNIYSVPNLPVSAKTGSIFHPLVNNNSHVKIQDEAGNSFENWGIFGGWQDNIGDMAPTEGYKIKVSKTDSVEVCGKPVVYPFPIALKPGWNLMGYPQTKSFNAKEVIQQLINRGSLVKVQDEAGNSIEDWGIFGGWTSNIGDFIPGKGYKIKVKAADTLWIYESYPKSSAIMPVPLATKHYVPGFDGNGVDHMNINLVGLPMNLLKPGDELAIFEGTTCVGAVVVMPYHLNNQTVSIAASATDNQGMTGFTDGSPITLKLWSSESKLEFSLEPEIIKGNWIFTRHETTFASLDKYAVTGLDGLAMNGVNEINCYPNPFSDDLTVEIRLAKESEVQVEALNQLGQLVKMITAKQLLPNGLHKIIWNGRTQGNQTLSPGIYYIKVNIDGINNNKKIVFTP